MKKLVDWIYPSYKKEIMGLKRKHENFIVEKNKLFDNLKMENVLLSDRIRRKTWDNPYGWNSYVPDYETRDGLKVPPNIFITPNDKKIKEALIRSNIHKYGYKEIIWKLEEWVYNKVRYKRDLNQKGEVIEDWRTASEIFVSKADDCDGYAILYQTCMHILGYGKKCVVITNGAEFPNYVGGHAYNKVLIDEEWVIVDPTNPSKFRDETWKYDIKYSNLNWFFNYWGTYKLPYGRVLK